MIGEFVLIDRPLEATLLGPVLLGLLVEELDTDTSIEAVGVHDVDAALEQPVLVLEAVDGFFAEVLLISLAPHQDVSDTAQRLVVEGEATHVLGELLVEDFLPDVGFRAFSLVVRAVIVDVPLFLQLTHEQTTTVAAPDELRKGEFTFRLPAFRCAAISPDLLDLVPQFMGHEWLMAANVRLVFPDELAVVERIFQHVLDDRPEAAVL